MSKRYVETCQGCRRPLTAVQRLDLSPATEPRLMYAVAGAVCRDCAPALAELALSALVRSEELANGLQVTWQLLRLGRATTPLARGILTVQVH